MLDIGITLRKLRNKQCFTQQFTADCLGISRITYRKWENNEVDFSITQLKAIAEFYNLKIEDIIKASYVINITNSHSRNYYSIRI